VQDAQRHSKIGGERREDIIRNVVQLLRGWAQPRPRYIIRGWWGEGDDYFAPVWIIVKRGMLALEWGKGQRAFWRDWTGARNYEQAWSAWRSA